MSAGVADRTKARVRDALIIVAGAALAVLIVSSAVRTASGPLRPLSPLQRLRSDPLDLAALRDLALAMDRRGDRDRAQAAMDFVGRRTWRDAPTLGWLLRSRTQDGRLIEAMEIADAILRQDGVGGTRPLLFPALIAAVGDDEARMALAARLDLAPAWRSDFLRALATTGDPARISQVFAALSTGPAPPTPAEYAPFVNRLVDARDYPAAAVAWRDLARKPGGAPSSGDDGDFSLPFDGTPFTWRPADGVGAGSDIVAAPEDPGHVALRVDYDGYATPTLPARLLALAPGRYRISWRERRRGAGEATVFWRVRCADTGEVKAREAGGPVGAGGPGGGVWSVQAMDVDFPAGVCGGQWLELAAAPGERRSPASTWYERLTVAPAA